MQRPTARLRGRLLGKDLPSRIRPLHEKLQGKMSRALQGRHRGAVLSVTAMAICVLSFSNGAGAAEDFKKLNSAQIRRSFAAMEFTDQVHWVERYGADGTLTTREMGKTRVGTWHSEDDQLCVDLGKDGGRGCYEVWISGNKVELRTPGSSAYPAQGVLQKPTNNR